MYPLHIGTITVKFQIKFEILKYLWNSVHIKLYSTWIEAVDIVKFLLHTVVSNPAKQHGWYLSVITTNLLYSTWVQFIMYAISYNVYYASPLSVDQTVEKYLKNCKCKIDCKSIWLDVPSREQLIFLPEFGQRIWGEEHFIS